MEQETTDRHRSTINLNIRFNETSGVPDNIRNSLLMKNEVSKSGQTFGKNDYNRASASFDNE